jgi:hypothetical protein
VIFSEYPGPVFLKRLSSVATKGVAMRFGDFFLQLIIDSLAWRGNVHFVCGAWVKTLTSRAFDVSRVALNLRQWFFS